VSRESRPSSGPKKPCCMVSEILEEAGIDRERARRIRRQVLEGIILLCRWQLERMDRPAAEPGTRKARRVSVE